MDILCLPKLRKIRKYFWSCTRSRNTWATSEWEGVTTQEDGDTRSSHVHTFPKNRPHPCRKTEPSLNFSQANTKKKLRNAKYIKSASLTCCACGREGGAGRDGAVGVALRGGCWSMVQTSGQQKLLTAPGVTWMASESWSGCQEEMGGEGVRCHSCGCPWVPGRVGSVLCVLSLLSSHSSHISAFPSKTHLPQSENLSCFLPWGFSLFPNLVPPPWLGCFGGAGQRAVG